MAKLTVHIINTPLPTPNTKFRKRERNQLESSYKILRWGVGGGGWGGRSRKSFLWVQVAYHNRKVSFLASTPHSGGNTPTPHPWIHPCSKYHHSGGFNPLSSSVKIQNLLTGIHAFTYGTN